MGAICSYIPPSQGAENLALFPDHPIMQWRPTLYLFLCLILVLTFAARSTLPIALSSDLELMDLALVLCSLITELRSRVLARRKMPELIFKAFLSCSFVAEDRPLIDFFSRLIRSFDIEPLTYDFQEVGHLPEKVKERIVTADCLIAIATRRSKLEGSAAWSCPDWIQHEIALANAYKKPIAILLEEGVKIEGLIAMEERRQEFLRDQLLNSVDKVTRFLFNLRTYLESMTSFERMHMPVLLRHYLHVKEEIRSPELSVSRCETLMESLMEDLEAVQHKVELEDLTPGLSVKPKQFDFICKEMPAGTRVEAVTIEQSDRKFLWKAAFDPPLKKGQKVKYAFKLVRQNSRPFTREELMARIEAGTYESKEPICKACDWSISYPTSEFLFDIEFPENYEISKYACDVRMVLANLNAENELKRLREGNMFSVEKIIDKWTMSLKVAKPLQDHAYYIYYMPPRAADLHGLS